MMPVNQYQEYIQKYEAKIQNLSDEISKLSVYRLAVFILTIAIITVLANERMIALVLMAALLGFLGFGHVINRYNRMVYLKQQTAFLKEINEHEIFRLNNELSGFESGKHFISYEHPYIADFDVFGQHSLFQLINRTTTESGRVLLAAWLSAPASKDTILKRQEAIRELAPRLDWRQDFQASGMHFTNKKSDYHKFLEWIERPVHLLPQQTKYLLICILLSALSTAAAVYYVMHAFSENSIMSLLPLLVILIVNFFVLKKVKLISREILENIDNAKILGTYHALITRIEAEKFHSQILCKAQQTFSKDNYSAASEINALKKILAIFQNTGNLLYTIFNTLWLLDIYWILATERWKERNGTYLRGWASAVSEFEVLSSLAGFSYANPSFTFPEIKTDPYHIHFEKLGHPLISQEKRICNDFMLNGQGQIAMITGSNMAGKSTFLRSLGVNLALALMGAPCCASAGEVSHMKVFSSMRTLDKLEEGISSFYAELKRVEQLLKLIESRQAVFFLLDEMFKGTNSEDRHKGGFSLIKQLSELNAFGIISTHDLELAKLAGQHSIVINYSFNSEIKEDIMTFNYTLTPGLCQDFNASALMKKSGIKVLTDIDIKNLDSK
ncbi:MutS-related protein [Catalinimonas niigatensis]|uniref:MutS-related protein n=1 Tax=Catalinimonas niigatensis TaxID=1397264 RepID=UPI002665F7D8|nr:DNA mismatch repair protein MutS [Catalinimonas niigatensis]WPP53265.1 DNA mismatch repair protein MutS [Catalinimonas niigatensis]